MSNINKSTFLAELSSLWFDFFMDIDKILKPKLLTIIGYYNYLFGILFIAYNYKKQKVF